MTKSNIAGAFAFLSHREHNGAMASDIVQQIKDRLSIVDVVSQYVKLDRAGTILRARCPFHAERTPSFIVSPERGTYHCFGCGVGGDIFSFTEAIEGTDFKGALKVLADKAGVEIVYEGGQKGKKDERDRLFELMETATIFYTTRLDEAAKKYLKERGINEQTIKEFRVGWAGNDWSDASDYLHKKGFSEKELIDAGVSKKNERGSLTDKFRNRIMFPIADSAGRPVAFSGRSFGPDASAEAPKYLNSPETALYHKSRILYGFDRAKLAMRKHNCAVLVEGQMDLIASHQAGWGNTVAVSGTAFTPEHSQLLHRMTDNLVLALDADAAGIKAAGKAARAALHVGLNVKVAKLPTGLDPADLIVKEGPDAWRIAIRDSKDIITFLLDVLQEHTAPQKVSQDDAEPAEQDPLRQRDRFRRMVETIVLPYLQEVGSPIAQEQYIREIARRLDVSESAVQAALARLPKEGGQVLPPPSPTLQGPDTRKPIFAPGYERAKKAYSLLLWQKALAQSDLDIEGYERDFEIAIGEDGRRALQELTDTEKEEMRFMAELLYGKTDLLKEAKTLLRVILQERLARELSIATQRLKDAEIKGDEDKVSRLMAESKLLTERIAQMHASM